MAGKMIQNRANFKAHRDHTVSKYAISMLCITPLLTSKCLYIYIYISWHFSSSQQCTSNSSHKFVRLHVYLVSLLGNGSVTTLPLQ
jgi:hypothetical protein